MIHALRSCLLQTWTLEMPIYLVDQSHDPTIDGITKTAYKYNIRNKINIQKLIVVGLTKKLPVFYGIPSTLLCSENQYIAPTLSQINLIHFLTPYSFNTLFNSFHISKIDLLNSLFYSCIPAKILYAFLVSRLLHVSDMQRRMTSGSFSITIKMIFKLFNVSILCNSY
jgi:hypothetical protein